MAVDRAQFFGLGPVSLNWTAGQPGFSLRSLLKFRASAMVSSLYSPWIVSFSLPLGAILFWKFRKRLTKQEIPKSSRTSPFRLPRHGGPNTHFMKTTLQLQAQDLVDAMWLHLRPRRGLRYVLLGLVALYGLMIVLSVYGWATRGFLDKSSLWGIGFGAYIALLFFVFLPWKTRRSYRTQKTLHSPFTVELSDEGVRLEALHGQMSMPWKDYHKWKANDKLILLYQSDRLYNPIPRRAFASDADWQALHALVQSKMGTQRV